MKDFKSGLFIDQGLFQQTVIQIDPITYMPAAQRDDLGVIDDIYDELIEVNI